MNKIDKIRNINDMDIECKYVYIYIDRYRM